MTATPAATAQFLVRVTHPYVDRIDTIDSSLDAMSWLYMIHDHHLDLHPADDEEQAVGELSAKFHGALGRGESIPSAIREAFPFENSCLDISLI